MDQFDKDDAAERIARYHPRAHHVDLRPLSTVLGEKLQHQFADELQVEEQVFSARTTKIEQLSWLRIALLCVQLHYRRVYGDPIAWIDHASISRFDDELEPGRDISFGGRRYVVRRKHTPPTLPSGGADDDDNSDVKRPRLEK